MPVLTEDEITPETIRSETYPVMPLDKDLSEVLILDEFTPKALKAFAGEFSNDVLFDLSRIIDHVDHLSSPEGAPARDEALRLMGSYMNQRQTDEKRDYLLSVASDVILVNQYADRILDNIAKDPNVNIDLKSAINPASAKPIDQETWLNGKILPNLEELDDLTDEINIETILLKSAQLLKIIKDPSVIGAERMQTVLKIEAIYAPVCEVLGFDALAATLISEANCTRLEMSGNGQYIDLAKQLIGSMGPELEVESFVERLPGRLVGESDTDSIVDADHDYGTFFTTAYSQFEKANGQTSYFDIISRRKTLGSLAMKLFRHNKEGSPGVPVDLLGMTIVTGDTDEVAEVFKTIVEKLQQESSVELKAAPSRQEALHVKGSAEFMDRVVVVARQSIDEPIDQPTENNNGFEVAKVTFIWNFCDQSGVDHDLPVEIQVTHQKSRQQSRIGEAAHINLKIQKYSEQLYADNLNFLKSQKHADHLANIRARKDTINKHNMYVLNPISRGRIGSLMAEIEQAFVAGESADRLESIY